jgi:hypothetical protein
MRVIAMAPDEINRLSVTDRGSVIQLVRFSHLYLQDVPHNANFSFDIYSALRLACLPSERIKVMDPLTQCYSTRV